MIKRYIFDELGVAATEFALMTPPLLFMLIGIFDYGTYINRTMKLENTAFSAAQYVRAGGLEENLRDDILLESNLGLTVGNIDSVTLTVDYTFECADAVSTAAGTDCGEGDYLRQFVEVTLSETLSTLIPYPGLSDELTITESVRLQNN